MSIFHDKLRVEFSDTDAAGIVHFANYFRYMERVEHAFWRSLGLSVQSRVGGHEIGFPRVKVDCEFLAPVRFEDELHATLTLDELGTKSVTFHFEFHREQTLVARGRTIAVCCRVGPNGTMKSVEIPDSIRKPLTDFVQSRGTDA